MKSCKDKFCPKRLSCAIAQKLIEGSTTIFKGYSIKDKSCNFYQSIKAFTIRRKNDK